MPVDGMALLARDAGSGVAPGDGGAHRVRQIQERWTRWKLGAIRLPSSSPGSRRAEDRHRRQARLPFAAAAGHQPSSAKSAVPALRRDDRRRSGDAEDHRTIETVSQNKTVLITGREAAPARELVARTARSLAVVEGAHSSRSIAAPFSESLLDNQFFGHRRAHVPGALTDQEGVFRRRRRHAVPDGVEIPLSRCRASSCARSRARDRAARHDPSGQRWTFA